MSRIIMHIVRPKRGNVDNGPEAQRYPRRRWVALFALLVLALVAASSTHVRIGVKSAVFLGEIFPDAPAYPARWIEPEPERILVQFQHEDVFHSAFLYRPPDPGCYAGIVLYIGLGPEHSDTHLDRISRAFARNGIAVLIPFSIDMVNFRLSPEEHLIAASAYRYLGERLFIDFSRVGMFGVSVGGAVVANAAQERSISGDVAMVHSLGGYFDATTMLVDMALGSYEVNGERVEWDPSPATWRATRNSIVPLMPAEDRPELRQLFNTDATEVPAGLTDEGELLARLLVNQDPEQAPELVEAIPDELLRFLDSISPSHGIEHLQARTFLLHDRFDHVLPYSESLRFAESAPRESRPYLTVIEQFHHVRPDEEGDRLGIVSDGVNLYRHIFRMHQALDDRGWFTSPLNLIPGLGSEAYCGH